MPADSLKENMSSFMRIGLLVLMTWVMILAARTPLVVASHPPTVTIRATDPSAAEWGPDPGEFTITRGGTTGSLTVHYVVAGSADQGTDYVNLPATVTIASGTASVTLPVIPIDDVIEEGDETVRVTLVSNPNFPAAYNVGAPSSATVTIADDDTPIRIAMDPIGRRWLYLFDPLTGGPSADGLLFEGPNPTAGRVVFFEIDRNAGDGRIYLGANATAEIGATVDFGTGRIWIGANRTGPLAYTLTPNPSASGPEVRVHAGTSNGPVVYTISGDDVYTGPNVTRPFLYHGSRPFWGPVQFLLPLIADGLIP